MLLIQKLINETGVFPFPDRKTMEERFPEIGLNPNSEISKMMLKELEAHAGSETTMKDAAQVVLDTLASISSGQISPDNLSNLYTLLDLYAQSIGPQTNEARNAMTLIINDAQRIANVKRRRRESE